MKSFLMPIFASLFVTPVCLAGGIFKCTDGSGVTYQSAPCAEGTLQVVLATPTTKRDANVNDSVLAATLAAPAPAEQSGISLIEVGLQPGISDLQVLNDRHWGRPQRITRNREARAWHEYWNYQRGPASGTRLHFVNAKLVNITRIESPGQTVATTSMVVAANRQQKQTSSVFQ